MMNRLLTRRLALPLAAVVLTLLTLPAVARAQALSFAQLRDVLDLDETVVVVPRTGERTVGRVAEITSSSLTVKLGERRGDALVWGVATRTFAEADVLEIRRSDSAGRRVFVADLGQVVRTGQTVVVTERDGRRTTGQIAEVSPSSLIVLTQRLEKQTISPDSVQRIAPPHRTWDGAVKGLAVGLVIWLIIEKNCYDCVGTPLPLLGTTTAIGYGIDALIGVPTFYRAAPAARTVSLSPMLSSERKGVRLSVRF